MRETCSASALAASPRRDRRSQTRQAPATADGCAGPSTAPSAAPRSCGPASRPSTSTARPPAPSRSPPRPRSAAPCSTATSATRTTCARPIADEIVEQVIASVLPHLNLDAESTPRDVITSTIGAIIGLFADHPNYYLFLRDQRNEQALGAVETTLADRVAVLLQALMVFFGLDGDEAQPGAQAWSASSSPAARGGWPAATSPARSRASGSPHTVCQAIWHMLEGVARANGVVDRLRRPAAVRARRCRAST